MSDAKNSKKSVLNEVMERLATLTEEEMAEKQSAIESNLLTFANFLESELALLYINRNSEIPTEKIIRTSLDVGKGIVLPAYSESKHSITLLRVTDYDADLLTTEAGVLEPNPATCKKIPLDLIDIALIPGLAFDEKGGRVGFGEGFYNKLITKLPETTRKVSIAFEEQIVDAIQMDSRKYNVDIIITDKRTIFKI
ncbi:5-formyltetrahydrofolate cyclo-ligase (5,10-methenyl-tetrahydrofolate synthetase) (Methenyl-THF synthetase) (MTHFS) [Desulfamplus magnetovallimortis]|uniref:5-formyltetrahydrofolate cyclo-ligase n=1 Tax=Desulfamplus magnetovallimortis TaxID=1246637 RepID=A0A1W1HH15_9BACT|nr:5-formyltetrahydrofolate cyclo-ligase [Desulfamplus magnetovallimortis]SLM31736.1 5-formyltetrahydrofolate cyclo-ligase (5,10-methenyl-tetrahydrofolate synthetase) (Methenyl-THF synthetase) (MTHFS) [Desulfamplus magnetovallimortis]